MYASLLEFSYQKTCKLDFCLLHSWVLRYLGQDYICKSLHVWGFGC
jgi:hypothetical protein